MEFQDYESEKKKLRTEGRFDDLLALCLHEKDGSVQSDLDIAEAYMLCRPNSPEIIKHLRRAKEEKNAYAAYLLGMCMQYGLGTQVNYDEADKLYTEAADSGYAPATMRAAHFRETYSLKPDSEEAFRLYERAAIAGYKTAQLRLAVCYEQGTGTQRNPEEAFRWCKLASDAGNNRATATLGRYYETGFGTPVSLSEAKRCYESAAAGKNVIAQVALHRLDPNYTMPKLAALYDEEFTRYYDALCKKYSEETVSCANDYDKADDPTSLLICAKMANALKRYCGYMQEYAFDWFSRAAKAGDPEALWHLAYYFESGKYAVQNPRFAYELIRKAAGMKYLPAVFALGFFYETGTCVERNTDLAVKCYETAAHGGYTPACAFLATFYETGTFFEADEKKAEEYYAMVREKRDILEPWAEIDKCYLAINPSDITLQYRIYRYEEIRSEDSSKYFGAYGRIADLGCVYAMLRLARMYEEGTSKSMKRLDRAFYYYKLASDAGYEPAKREYARFCAENPTVEAKYYATSEAGDSSPERAFEIYKAAAEAGDATAMLYVAKCYYEGTGTETDEDEAYRMAVMAQHRGQRAGTDFGRHVIEYPEGTDESTLTDFYRQKPDSPAAIFSLGVCLKVGVFCEKNEKEAFALLQKAAGMDYRWAHFELGRCFETGCGTEPDIHAAAEQYLIALDEADPLAVKHFTKYYSEYSMLQMQNPGDYALMCLTALCQEKGYGTDSDATAAFAQYSLAARNGYVTAEYFVGKCYELGTGTEKNNDAAFSSYKSSSDAGCGAALCALGRMYEFVLKDRINAVLSYKGAAKKGNSCGNYNTGRFSLSNDAKTALEHLLLAADCENCDAQKLLGDYYEEQGDMTTAIAWFERAGNSGNTDAEVHLGMHYLKSSDPADKKKAYDLFTHAARKGNAEGMLRVAECIARGMGTQKNPAAAVKSYIKAADAGNMNAQYSLGSCYERGFGTEVDLARAVHYYSLAANQGHDDAQYALGSCLAKGKGIQQNMELAVYWYQRAVEKNNDKAGTALGICYENGQGGLTPDMDRAVELYHMSAEKNNYIAKYRLGLCCEQGKGMPFDPAAAFDWFMQSAQAGNTIAQYKVAECLMAGQGTAQDVPEAIEWYKKAATGKSPDACSRLSYYYAHGYGGVEQNMQLAAEWAKKAEEYGSKKKARKKNS